MARELRDASHVGTGIVVVVVVVSFDVQHRELLWCDIQASSDEAGRDAALVNVALDHFGGTGKGGIGLRGRGRGCPVQNRWDAGLKRETIICSRIPYQVDQTNGYSFVMLELRTHTSSIAHSSPALTCSLRDTEGGFLASHLHYWTHRSGFQMTSGASE